MVSYREKIKHYEKYCQKGKDPLKYAKLCYASHTLSDALKERRQRKLRIKLQRSLVLDETDDDAWPILWRMPLEIKER